MAHYFLVHIRFISISVLSFTAFFLPPCFLVDNGIYVYRSEIFIFSIIRCIAYHKHFFPGDLSLGFALESNYLTANMTSSPNSQGKGHL